MRGDKRIQELYIWQNLEPKPSQLNNIKKVTHLSVKNLKDPHTNATQLAKVGGSLFFSNSHSIIEQ